MASAPDLCLFGLSELVAPLKQAGASLVEKPSFEAAMNGSNIIVVFADAVGREELRRLVDAFSRRRTRGLIVHSGTDEVWHTELILRGAAECLVRQEPEHLARLVLHAASREYGYNRDEAGLQRLLRSSPDEMQLQSLKAWLSLAGDRFDEAPELKRAQPFLNSANSIVRAIMVSLVRQLGWRTSSIWLQKQPVLGGRTCMQLLWDQQYAEVALRTIFGGAVKDYLDPLTDRNLVAFRREQELLERDYPGQIVAYFGGKRLAISVDAQQLEREIPEHLRQESIMVQDLAEPAVRIRRPQRIISEH